MLTSLYSNFVDRFSYAMCIKSCIIPYFKEFKLALKDVTPKHIQDYYQYELNEKGLSASTVIHRHANIRKALQYAYKVGLIAFNPADRIERPKTAKFVGSIYDAGELTDRAILQKVLPWNN